MAKLGELYRRLTDSDMLILEYMVSNIRKYEYIPVENFMKKFRRLWSQKEVIARINKLNELGIVKKHESMDAYRLKIVGLDCIAIHRLVSSNVIKALGDSIGVGKESIIFKGLASNGDIVAIKFYRIGRRSFRHITKVRLYVTNEDSSWLIRSIVTGEREKEALTILNRHGIPGVPRLYGHALHTIVIEFIDGVNLYKVNRIDNPLEIFRQIINIIKNSYRYAGIVHGDLSEYNIMIQYSNDLKPYVIDWPQYVLADEPRALDVLKRDVIQLTKFFNRRFRVGIDPDGIIKHITTSNST
ncbi:MAG: hypothetical protein N3E36_07110 [Sulfolobales archaeon]|nr:serine/threonine protein kinase [Ignisphaera sp.]MCX8199761.1 hypothetical protein [Sulfolobales archaeon]MDW8085002.1 RIO1 family regulatory kinase/ATPase [Ignisphaera sp.]